LGTRVTLAQATPNRYELSRIDLEVTLNTKHTHPFLAPIEPAASQRSGELQAKAGTPPPEKAPAIRSNPFKKP